MSKVFAICLSILIQISYCTPCNIVVPGWTESYCPEDIDRIEYQIPMDEVALNGNGRAGVDDLLSWMVNHLQHGVYQNFFRLRTEKIKKYYREVHEISITKSGSNKDIIPPRASALKYRRSIGNFVEGDSKLKYKNDLTMENAMTTPGSDVDYAGITPKPAYEDIYGTKLEANIVVEGELGCKENALSTTDIIYGESGTGFSGKIEFDDDDMYGTNDTNAINMIDTSKWSNVENQNDFYCDCSTADCVCCDGQEYFEHYCSYYADDPNLVTTTYKYPGAVYHYILDIDFYWHQDGNMSTDETSKGKFTFQIKYNNRDDMNNDVPNSGGTEMSMKLYKSKTIDGHWDGLKTFSEGLVDRITSIHSDSSQWIDHRNCKSDIYCCTNLQSTSQKWINTCTGFETQNTCEKPSTKKGHPRCQWIACSDVGDCQWTGNGANNLDKLCKKKTIKADCETSFNGNCEWILRNPPVSDERILFGIINMETDTIYGTKFVFGAIFGLLLITAIAYIVYCRYTRIKQKKLNTTEITPLITIENYE